jgi:hypothetical protein
LFCYFKSLPWLAIATDGQIAIMSFISFYRKIVCRNVVSDKGLKLQYFKDLPVFNKESYYYEIKDIIRDKVSHTLFCLLKHLLMLLEGKRFCHKQDKAFKNAFF